MSKKDPNRELTIGITGKIEFQPGTFQDEQERYEAVSKIRKEIISYLNHKCGSTHLGKDFKNAEIIKFI